MKTRYLLAPYVRGLTPEIEISQQEYLDAKRCHMQNYAAFEIELAFDFLIENYIDIEKYIGENLIVYMIGRHNTADTLRMQQYGFMRIFNNWLASISFWRNLTRNRMVSICGRGSEIKQFDDAHEKLQMDEFAYAFCFQLRNYSQHGGFPVTGSLLTRRWKQDLTEMNIGADYTLNYEDIRSHFEKDGKGADVRRAFGKRIEAHGKGNQFDIKPIIRQSLEIFGNIMDDVRSFMSKYISENERFVLNMIKHFKSTYPDASIIGLSAMSVDQRKLIKDKSTIIPVRDEFIFRAREMRKRNNGKILASMEKRIVSNR